MEVGFFIHSISIPPKASNRLVGINRFPGFRVAMGFPTKNSNVYRYLSAAFYHQQDLHFGYQLEGQYSFSQKIGNSVELQALSGIGYLHTFEDAPQYKIKSNVYREKRDWGRSQFTVSLGIGAGYLIPNTRYQVNLQYQFLLQFPFAAKGNVFFVPHNRIHLTMRRYVVANR